MEWSRRQKKSKKMRMRRYRGCKEKKKGVRGDWEKDGRWIWKWQRAGESTEKGRGTASGMRVGLQKAGIIQLGEMIGLCLTTVWWGQPHTAPWEPPVKPRGKEKRREGGRVEKRFGSCDCQYSMMENKERGNAMDGRTNTSRERKTQTRHEMRSIHCKREKQKRENWLHNTSAS